MKIAQEELIPILAQLNPWWRKDKIPDLPTWTRSAFQELLKWVINPPAPRAVMLAGARQVGKTTLLLQIIDYLIKNGVQPTNILYASFDHPIFKLAGLDAVLDAWRELEPKKDGQEYLFLDEAQFIREFGTWVKHQVDFFKSKRIIFTGSASPLTEADQESGVGRWHTMKISTLSFYEYLKIKRINTPNITSINSIDDLFLFKQNELFKISEATHHLIGHFHEYLVRGGFPQTALVDSVPQAQRLLREDIIDKVLKRDMTAMFGVRRVIELEQMFIYLCMHDGGLQDISTLSSNLGVTKPTINNFINLFEQTHLLYRLPPFGYGKNVLRARYKLYLADPAIAPAILLKGKSLIEDSRGLGNCVENAVCHHLSSHSGINDAKFSYWKDGQDREVDLILETYQTLLPFEVKYISQSPDLRDVQGLVQFCKQKVVKKGFILTKSPNDIGLIDNSKFSNNFNLMKIPASIFCYWLGESETSQKNILLKSSIA